MPRWIAWRIHHVAYVENLKPLRQSNLSTAWMRPRLPSCTMSRSGRPGRLVLLGDRHDEAKVRVHELAVRLFALADRPAELTPLRGRHLLGRLQLGARFDALFDGLGEADLVVLGQQIVESDVLEVEADEVLVVTILAAGLDLRGHVFLRVAGRMSARSAETGQHTYKTPEPRGLFPETAGVAIPMRTRIAALGVGGWR